MRNISWWAAGLFALAAVGCNGSNTPVATTTTDALTLGPAAPVNADLGSIFQTGDVVEGAVALYTLDVDPDALSATSHLKALRAGQETDDLYMLPLDGFFKAESFQVTSVAVNGTDLDVGFQIEHPFPAPNDPLLPPNAGNNRSDLAVAGRILMLADAVALGNTYFTDRIANTSLVGNADAYLSPGGMINTSGLTANTFPYLELVDETGPTGSRVGVSNGGVVTGNFGNDGWVRDEYGAGNIGWTGYGILNQGQTSSNLLKLDLAEIAGGFTFDIALLVKYQDPRGGTNGAQKRANRLPPATADATLFAFRMPHGALDVSKIEFLAQDGSDFIADTISSSTLHFRVEDWDARGTPSPQANLHDDSSFTNVAQGEQGLPDLAISIPGVLGDATVIDDWDPLTDTYDDDSAFPNGDGALDSGMAGDGIYYRKTVTKGVAVGQLSGSFTGMVRASDVESADPLFFPVDANLTEVTSNPPVPVTYQVFTVNQLSSNNLPTGDWTLDTMTITDGAMTSITVYDVVDGDSPTFGIEVDWGTGSFVSELTGQVPGVGPFGPINSPAFTLANPLVGEVKTILVRLRDETSTLATPATNLGGNMLTVDPVPACDPVTTGTQIFNANFSDQLGDNAWVGGYGGLINTDASGYSQFRTTLGAYCNASGAQTALSGGMINSGSDLIGVLGCSGFGCGINSDCWINDYGTNVQNNIASPVFSLAGATSAALRFDDYRNTGAHTSGVFNVYLSTDGGAIWGTPIYTGTDPGANIAQNQSDIVVPITSLGSANCRLRFEFLDPAGYISIAGAAAGWSFDNVEVFTCP